MNTTWLWPDHAISPSGSRTLREEHNKLANSHDELLKAIHALLEALPAYNIKDGQFPAKVHRQALEAISNAKQLNQ